MFGSILFTPRASPANPGVNGTPVLASNTPPTCHPPNAHAFTPCAHFGVLNSYVQFISTLWATLKSAKPRFNPMLNHNGLEIEFEFSSPTKLPDEVSIVLPHV